MAAGGDSARSKEARIVVIVGEYLCRQRDLAFKARVPALSDVPYPVQMEPNLVVEFYSR